MVTRFQKHIESIKWYIYQDTTHKILHSVTVESEANTKDESNASKKKQKLINWKDLCDIYTKLDKKDQDSFCIENTEDKNAVVSSSSSRVLLIF